MLFSSQYTGAYDGLLYGPESRDTLLAKQGVRHNHLVLKMSFKIYL